ncbi:MAG: hypothetical protein MJ131_07880 [Lachnospiraceae bacterium]|nr:hypothetical protein [Lachnospiraceae bacterium]
MKKYLYWLCLVITFGLAIFAIYSFVAPFVKAFLIYQDGVTEQEAFNEIVLPLLKSGWLTAFISGVLAFGVLRIGLFIRGREEE